MSSVATVKRRIGRVGKGLSMIRIPKAWQAPLFQPGREVRLTLVGDRIVVKTATKEGA